MGQNLTFIGRGWSFPPKFSNSSGSVEMLEQEADIASSLEILLQTARGERVMLPQYGCNLDELVFESLDTRMKTLMTDKIESAILYALDFDLFTPPFEEMQEVSVSQILEVSENMRIKTGKRLGFRFQADSDQID